MKNLFLPALLLISLTCSAQVFSGSINLKLTKKAVPDGIKELNFVICTCDTILYILNSNFDNSKRIKIVAKDDSGSDHVSFLLEAGRTLIIIPYTPTTGLVILNGTGFKLYYNYKTYLSYKDAKNSRL